MSSLLTAANVGRLVLVLAIASVGYYAGQSTAPQPDAPAPDTVTVERQLVKRDTVTETVPRTVVRYDTVRRVDTAHVPVPTDMTFKGVIAPRPVDVSSEEIALSYFDPKSRQWTQNRYSIPDEHWALWPEVEIRTTPVGLQASALANLRWRKVTVSAGYMQAAQARGITASIELRPFTISW